MADALYTIKPLSKFRTYNPEHEEDNRLGVYFLLQIADSSRAEDHFRFHLSGRDKLDVEFAGRDLIPVRSFRQYMFWAQVHPGELELRQNCVSTDWVDLASMVEAGQLLVELAGSRDATEAFKVDWAAAKAEDPGLGAGLRWILLASSDGLKLELQTLPLAAHALNRDPRFANDACPAVTLASFAAEAHMEPKEPLNGPVPVLFAKHLELARESLKRDPTKLAKGKTA